MTARTRLKRLARARMARTGESYTSALRVLLGRKESGLTTTLYQTIRHDEGFSIRLPVEWAARLEDSPENLSAIARYAPVDGRCLCVVFHHGSGVGRLSTSDIAEATAEILADGGMDQLARHDGLVAGHDGVVLVAARQVGDARWQWRYSFARVGDDVWVLGLGTADPVQDSELLDGIAETFSIVEAPPTSRERKGGGFAPNVARTTARARQLAIGMQHAHVGTEHLLVAMLSDSDCAAARLLARKGVSLDALRAAIAAFPKAAGDAAPALSARAEQVLATRAHELARSAEHATTRTDHILMAVVLDEDATAARLLALHGPSAASVRESIGKHWEELATRNA